MKEESLSHILQYWRSEVENRQQVPTQYPNSKIDLDKSRVYCEISTANEVTEVDGQSFDGSQAEGEQSIVYRTETGDMIFTLFDDRGEGEGEIYRIKDCILEIFTERNIGAVEFKEARIVPLVPVDEKWLVQVVAPYETCYQSAIKENIP